MLSPAEPGPGVVRRILERLAHGAALALLAGLLVRSLSSQGQGPAERAGAGALPAALARWSTVDRPARVQAVVDGDIPPVALDWLAALVRTGTPVTWEGDPSPVAAVDDPVADPGGATRVRVAAPAGTEIVLEDAFGPLDSAATGPTGATFLARSAPSWIVARSGRLAARATVPDSLVFGRLLLLGRVGWESKFVAAALEERGWKVDARLALSPKGNVAEGGAVRLDTSRYSAVIVLDSLAPADLAAIGPYLRAGGGAILTAPSLRAPALRALGAARQGAGLRAAEPFDTSSPAPRSSLAVAPIADWPGQLVLESRDGQAAVAARRVERGRLVVVGYLDTWRWRMAGRGDAAGQHRDWWAGLVAGVAHVGREPRPVSGAGADEAPLAHLMDRLGPSSRPITGAAAGLSISNALLFGAMAGLFLLGWTSRRFRGAP
jgi:hypothetical protein